MKTLLALSIVIILFSCNEPAKIVDNKEVQYDTLQSDFIFTERTDSIIENGEYIKYYKNGVIEMQGTMKNGQRNGVWKSWYEDGSPWSETNFLSGKKNGKTISWYPNGNKRYEGSYKDDLESETWTFWDEKSKTLQTKHY
ncbi:MAG: hypothetical protein V4608_10165 [Bacteroidota bacterium]